MEGYHSTSVADVASAAGSLSQPPSPMKSRKTTVDFFAQERERNAERANAAAERREANESKRKTVQGGYVGSLDMSHIMDLVWKPGPEEDEGGEADVEGTSKKNNMWKKIRLLKLLGTDREAEANEVLNPPKEESTLFSWQGRTSRSSKNRLSKSSSYNDEVSASIEANVHAKKPHADCVARGVSIGDDCSVPTSKSHADCVARGVSCGDDCSVPTDQETACPRVDDPCQHALCKAMNQACGPRCCAVLEYCLCDDDGSCEHALCKARGEKCGSDCCAFAPQCLCSDE
ncbi:hypothetical protein CYMTET_54193, partial [Cymbomonas tetramitiformis]